MFRLTVGRAKLLLLRRTLPGLRLSGCERDQQRKYHQGKAIWHGGVPPGRPGVINLHADVFSLRCRYLRKVKQRQRCVQERKKYRTDPGLKSTSLKCEA